MDFTINIFVELLNAIDRAGYSFITYEDFISNARQPDKYVILRHDIDRKPYHALRMAEIEYGKGIRASYFFRMTQKCFKEDVIRKIVAMQHEIAYQYEELARNKGNYELAFYSFKDKLEKLRNYYPVVCISMHGSPLSPYDNKLLWEKYDYHMLGIKADVYLDTDFKELAYFTDTGRTWANTKVGIRDYSCMHAAGYKNTSEIIHAFKQHNMPNAMMFTIHSNRWNTNAILWTEELILQKIKNQLKRLLKLYR